MVYHSISVIIVLNAVCYPTLLNLFLSILGLVAPSPLTTVCIDYKSSGKLSEYSQNTGYNDGASADDGN